ncbi:MAG: hypothetical protein PVI75_03585 [Gammaproteobacteria bacterium]|jgi:hypothetical protein
MKVFMGVILFLLELLGFKRKFLIWRIKKYFNKGDYSADELSDKIYISPQETLEIIQSLARQGELQIVQNWEHPDIPKSMTKWKRKE